MKTVYFDVDTQYDFMLPSGALYVRGAEHIVARIAGLNREAEAAGIPLISTTDAHTENDPEFREWPPHCIAGTLGQRKPESTLLQRRSIVSAKPGPVDIAGFDQIILEKQHVDCFTNPHLPAVLSALKAERYVVYGVATEVCVRFAAFGLLKTGRRVEIIANAVGSLDRAKGEAMLGEFRSLGGYVT